MTVVTPDRSSRLIVDIAWDMQRQGLLQFFEQSWRRYGELPHLQIGPQHVFLVVHPDDVRYVTVTQRDNYDKLQSYDVVRELLLGNGLVTSRGALWRRQRRIMAPFFTPRGILQFYDLVVSDGLKLAERWETLAANGRPVEIMDEMTQITASIILRSMFSTDADAHILDIKDDVETMIQFVSTREMNPLSAPLWMPTPGNRRYQAAREHVHAFIDGVIARRRALPVAEWPDDLLGKLMLAQDDETGEAMSDSLLRDECITLFFAGHETTARTLTFMWYALDRNPAVAARLHAELDTVLGDAPPTTEQLKQLPFTLQVIKETLRLYPPAPIYVRDAVADDVLRDTAVPAGSRMMLFPYATHRHPDFWPEPERFDPDRWLPEVEEARHPYAYHPFAAGQRICIGNNFSLLESHILTAILARRFAPQLVPGHVPDIVMAGTLSIHNGLPMVIARR